jgi:two-component system CheB/CheR fusion protein
MSGADGVHFVVVFQGSTRVEKSAPVEQASPKKVARRSKREKKESEEQKRLRELENELEANREYLQSVIQDLEAANVELQSANEEILSANEEFRSTNEELDTAKEELQSTNEELNTVNDELQGRNEALSRANSDLQNLLGSVQIAIVMISNDLCIRTFTPKAEEVLNLIATDVGRPISQIRPNINCPDLEERIRRVIDAVEAEEKDVRDAEGRWFSMRIRPYKDVHNRIDGAVLVLVDIEGVRRQEELRLARDFAEAIVETVREPLVILDQNLRIQRTNQAFLRTFQVGAPETDGRYLYALGDKQWNIPKLRTLLEEVLPKDSSFSDFVVEHDFPRIGKRKMLLNARRLELSGKREAMILLGIEDITDRPIELDGG